MEQIGNELKRKHLFESEKMFFFLIFENIMYSQTQQSVNEFEKIFIQIEKSCS